MNAEERILAWRRTKTSWVPCSADAFAMKVGEEAGEVLGAVTKVAEHRASLDDLRGEMGDVLVALSCLAAWHGWTLDELRSSRFEEVQRR